MDYEKRYLKLLKSIMTRGQVRTTRTGQVRTLFNVQLTTQALLHGFFPLLTVRKMYPKTFVTEAQWMLTGTDNIKYMTDRGVHIWDKFADENGHIGPSYGVQMMRQWDLALNEIGKSFASRRAIINLWPKPGELEQVKLPPCYHSFQFYCRRPGYMSIKVCSRSSDAAVGLPYDIATIAYILITACFEYSLNPDQICFSSTDMHINEENWDACVEMITREPLKLPKYLTDGNDFTLGDYNFHPAIKMSVKE